MDGFGFDGWEGGFGLWLWVGVFGWFCGDRWGFLVVLVLHEIGGVIRWGCVFNLT